MKQTRKFRLPTVIVFLLFCPEVRAAAPSPPPRILNPDYHLRLANRYLFTVVPEADRPYTRFLSWYGVPRDMVADFQSVMRWWMHNLHFGSFPVMPRMVPGTDRLLWALDLRDYKWNSDAWHAVASRDQYFREPWIDEDHAEFMRQQLGLKKDTDTLHCEGIIWAPWLFRDSIESNRSATYYDLLYAQDRFKKAGDVVTPSRTETITVRHPGGRYVYPDDSGRVVSDIKAGTYDVVLKWKAKRATTFTFVDFPKNQADWDEKFGVKATIDYLRKQEIDTLNGAIVAGSSDDPVNGSIVARNGRLVTILRTPLGWAGQTFDTKETSGERDFVEEFPRFFSKDVLRPFRKKSEAKASTVLLGKIAFDAGESLASLPAGGQAALLTNGVGTRIEKADTEFAHNKIDARYVDVRTAMGCVVCHTGDGGLIVPSDEVRKNFLAGIDVKLKDRETRNRIAGFFLDWNDKVEDYRRPYKKLIALSTRDPANPSGKAWTSVVLGAKFLAFRDWYDAPLTAAQASAELGVPIPIMRMLAAKSPRARLNALVQKLNTPRNVFEKDVFREMSLLLVAFRNDIDNSKLLVPYQHVLPIYPTWKPPMRTTR